MYYWFFKNDINQFLLQSKIKFKKIHQFHLECWVYVGVGVETTDSRRRIFLAFIYPKVISSRVIFPVGLFYDLLLLATPLHTHPVCGQSTPMVASLFRFHSLPNSTIPILLVDFMMTLMSRLDGFLRLILISLSSHKPSRFKGKQGLSNSYQHTAQGFKRVSGSFF